MRLGHRVFKEGKALLDVIRRGALVSSKWIKLVSSKYVVVQHNIVVKYQVVKKSYMRLNVLCAIFI